MQENSSRTRIRHLGLVAMSAILVTIGAGAYVLGRTAGEGTPGSALSDILPEPSAGDSAGQVQAIDTSKADWDKPFLEAYKNKPRSEVVVAGMRFGPTVERDFTTRCDGLSAQHASEEEARGSRLWFEAAYLPPGTSALVSDTDFAAGSPASKCAGEVVTYGAMAGVSAAPDAAARVGRGESWFVVPHGGRITVGRYAVDDGLAPAWDSNVPTDHWYGATINGHAAAVARPALDAGLGTGRVYIWDQDRDVVTIVSTYQLSLDELLKIAEGIK